MGRKPVVVQINSGLGNQMFQYAFGKALEKIHKCKVYYDVYSDFNTPTYRKLELEPFNIELAKASVLLLMRFKPLNEYYFQFKNHSYLTKNTIRILRKFFNNTCYVILKKLYKPCVLNENFIYGYPGEITSLNIKSTYLIGYFQNASIVNLVEKELRECYRLKADYLSKTIFFNTIKNSNSVSLHIRRGDYLLHSKFTVLSVEYYFKAIEYINNKIKSPVFFLFSDDISWAKNEFCDCNENIVFMNEKISNHACDDMLLMSYCKHNIIANSTYSWWGAWLNNNPDKFVIAPSTWYNENTENINIINNLLLNNWILI